MLGEANPAGPEPGRVGRKHQILGGQRTVLDGPVAGFHRRDHDQDWCVIKDVEVRVAQHVAVTPLGQAERGVEHVRLGLVGDLREQRLVLHHEEAPWLLVDGTRGLDRDVNELAKDGVGHRLIGIFPYRAASLDGFQHVHGRLLKLDVDNEDGHQTLKPRLHKPGPRVIELGQGEERRRGRPRATATNRAKALPHSNSAKCP